MVSVKDKGPPDMTLTEAQLLCQSSIPLPMQQCQPLIWSIGWIHGFDQGYQRNNSKNCLRNVSVGWSQPAECLIYMNALRGSTSQEV